MQSRLAVEFQNMIPENETPEQTEGYQGFYHLIGIESRCEEAKLSYIIRDHDRNRFENRKDFIEGLRKQDEREVWRRNRKGGYLRPVL